MQEAGVQPHPQKVLIWWKSGKNPLKIRVKSVEIWVKCVKAFTKSLYMVWIYKNGTQIQSADFFFKVMFFVQVRENLGRFGWNLGRNGTWSALIWKNAPNMKWNAVVFFIFFGSHFFGIFSGNFGAIWAKILRTPKNLPAPTPMSTSKLKQEKITFD